MLSPFGGEEETKAIPLEEEILLAWRVFSAALPPNFLAPVSASLHTLVREAEGKEGAELEAYAWERLEELARTSVVKDAIQSFLEVAAEKPEVLRAGLLWFRTWNRLSPEEREALYRKAERFKPTAELASKASFLQGPPPPPKPLSPSVQAARSSPPRFTPTPEQEEAVRAFLSREDMKLVAVAGSGKTTTLRLMAQSAPKERLLYVAFNRSVRDEAERTFPGNVEVLTLHGLAHRHVVRGSGAYQRKLAARDGRVTPGDVLEALELPRERYALAYVIRSTLEAFLRSASEVPTPAHIPPEYREVLQRRDKDPFSERYVLKAVRLIWKLMQDPDDSFPLSFDGFVKIWAQAGAKIRGYDAVLVDEAQDLSPVFLQVLEAHRGELRRVYVGDPRQQIYGWRGAVNAMDKLDAPERKLTWSFRFGEDLARGVRRFLAHVGSPIELHGKAPWDTEVSLARPEPPYTALCRTNAGAVEAVTSFLLEEGREGARVFVVGGVDEIAWLLRDAHLLKVGGEREKPHPELALVENWDELEELAKEVNHPQARMLVRLARRYDLLELARLLKHAQADEEGKADLVVSTLHKAKGREWDRVVLWGDFIPVWDEKVREFYRKQGALDELKEEENVVYVALTRARRFLGLDQLPDLHERFFQGEGLVKPPSVSPLSVGGAGVSADLLRELEVRVLAKLEDRLKEVAEVLAALLVEEASKAVAEAMREMGLLGEEG